MQDDQPKSTIYLSYAERDADFAYKLATDLKEIGFDVWVERFDLTSDEDFSSVLEHCGVIVPVLSASYALIRSRWAELAQLAETQEIQVIPLLLQDGSLPDSAYHDQRIDFRHWRNQFAYMERLETLAHHLYEHVDIQPNLIPDPETQYINCVVTDIKHYKSLLETLSPRSDALPSDKRAIYAQSMWGLTGAFEVLHDYGDGPTTTYQFYDITAEFPRFVLIGSTGVGKTTSLYRAVLDTLRAFQASRRDSPLPLFLHLGEWNSDTSLEAFIRTRWMQESDPIQLMAEGRVVAFLDGLDELGSSATAKIEALRDWLHGEQAPKQAVITCDETTYISGNQLDLPVILLKKIDAPRIRQYVINHLEKRSANRLLDRILSDDLADNSHVLRLARNALYLAIMVSIVQRSPDAAIPDHEALILQWLAESLWANQSEIPFDTALPALSSLAFNMLEDDMAAYVPYAYALHHVGAEAVLQTALDTRVLQMRGHNIAFSHQHLKHYFATYQLIEEGIYSHLMRAQFTASGERIIWKWDPVVILCSALVSDPSRLIREVADVNPYLALECIASGIQISEDIRQTVIDHLIEFTRSVDRAYLAKIAQALHRVGDAETMSALIEHLHGDLQRYETPTGDTDEDKIMPLKTLGTDTVRFLMEFLRGEKWQRRRGAAWALGELKEPVAVPSLVEALCDENESVRQEAAQALLRIGRPALPRLLQAVKDEDPDMRAATIKVLGKTQDASAVPSLINCLSDTVWPQLAEVRICDLAAIALENIGTDEALAAVDAWRETNTPATQNSEWREKINGQSVVVERKSSEQLLADLRSDDWSIRRDAVTRLGNSGNEIALPYLIHALKDDDSQVRWAAVKALEGFEGPEVLRGLLDALGDKDYLVCDTAAEALSNFGDPAVPGLIEALTDENVDVRGASAEALGKIGNEDAIPHLVDALQDTSTPRWEEGRICEIAAKALENIGTEKALFALSQWRREQGIAYPPAPEDIATPLLHLDELGQTSTDEDNAHRAALLQFLDTLHEDDWHAQQEAARALRDYARTLKGSNDAEAIERLSSALADDESLVRWSAAEALAWIGDTATPALLKALRDKNWTVRIAAVRALHEIESTTAIPGLLEALEDENHLVREVAAETLGKVGDESVTDALVNTLQDEESFVRRAAVDALGEIGGKSALPYIVELLDDPDLYVRWAAIEALGKIGDPAAIPALVENLSDTSGPEWEEKRICDVAADALDMIGTDEAQAVLEDWRAKHFEK